MAERREAHSESEIIVAPEPAAKPLKAVKLRPAASMVLLDRRSSEPKVLLGRRNGSLAFLPDKYVFPGGRLETDDLIMPAAGALRESFRERFMRRRARSGPTPEAFALAAIRETFEETGLLLGKKEQTAAVASIPASWQDFAAYGFAPNLTPLRFIARAVTPTMLARRYDTSFFLLDVSEIVHRIEGCIGPQAEFVELAWLTLAEAIQRDILHITAMILADLEARIAADFAENIPVPFFYMRGPRWICEKL
jgi:8-oxo-dGTP pyrophosphatase MutT (NUDIX family)